MPRAEFVEFIEDELKKRGWNYSDLSRQAGLQSGTLSNIMNSNRRPGAESCNAIAKALKVPPSLVFVKAGLMDPDPQYEETEKVLRATSLFNQLNEDEKEQTIAYMQFLIERRPGKG